MTSSRVTTHSADVRWRLSSDAEKQSTYSLSVGFILDVSWGSRGESELTYDFFLVADGDHSLHVFDEKILVFNVYFALLYDVFSNCLMY